jgi:hypothetical protein
MSDLFQLNETLNLFNNQSVIDELNSDGVLSELPEYTILSSYSEPIPPGPIPCFLIGTKILTDMGEKPIETLRKGMNLINHKGEKIKLLDVYSFKREKNINTHPCLVKKGELINNIECNSDLYLSQQHGVLINNYFVPIKKIVNPQKIEDNKDHYTYYHLVTENFFTDVIISNGIQSETYSKYIETIIGKKMFIDLLICLRNNDSRFLLEKNEFENILKIREKHNKIIESMDIEQKIKELISFQSLTLLHPHFKK